MEDMVVYRAEYGDFGLWVRPLAMFEETVERNGKILPRFELIESDSPKCGSNQV
jgi:hypothetical protein